MNTPARLGAYTAGLGAIFTAGDLAPGRVSKLVFTVSKDGRPVGDLVTIHAGGAAFAASAPSGGDSRLSPDFEYEGTVRRRHDARGRSGDVGDNR
ncbi:hypothetical protein ACQP2K_00755 [Microbispora siamensis]